MKTDSTVPPSEPPGLLGPARLLRYAFSGALSALAHIGTLTLLVEAAGMRPVWASNIGFALSVVVSYTLQKWWVFASAARHRTTVPKFLIATCAALLLNTVVVTGGTEVFSVHYVVVQMIALVLIPVSNYLINSLWTFR